MKLLFAFYNYVSEWKELSLKFPHLDFVFAENFEEVAKEIADTDVLFILAPNYSSDIANLVMVRAKKLKWIQVTTVGVDEIILNGIPSEITLTKAVGIYDANVAEQVMALLLAIIRQVAAAQSDKEKLQYNRQQRWEMTRSLEKKTIGIIGYGGIGKQVSKRAKAFDTRIFVYDIITNVNDDNSDDFFGPGQFENFLVECDVVVLTLPQTRENLYMFDTNTFKLMKRNSILINVSRGKLVKEDALVEALRSGLIAAAGLDVFEEEPLPKTSELWTMNNVVMTPHLGGQGDYNKYRLASLFEENIQRFLEGKDLKYVVDINKGF